MPATLDGPAALPPSYSARNFDQIFADVQMAIADDLVPNIEAIDRQGLYPRRFMQRIGRVGGFAEGTPSKYGGTGRGIANTIRVMEAVAKECLSTGFCIWCQTVCGWYIQNGESEYLKTEWLPRVSCGTILAGTGLSNPMKHFAGIEKIRIKAVRAEGGYVLNGALPWVSNVGVDHCFAAVAQFAGSDDYLMALIPGDSAGLTLGDGGHFIALEGSSTHNAIFKDVFVPDEFVLATPCPDYIARIRPGFILMQTGFGMGLVAGCIDMMRRSNARVGHVNRFLEDGPDRLEADLHDAQRRVYALADQIGCGGRDFGLAATQEAIKLRILASELALRSSQATMLHAGAAGYRTGSAAERKLRESYFVAVVTPALKHLKKLQHDMQAA